MVVSCRPGNVIRRARTIKALGEVRQVQPARDDAEGTLEGVEIEWSDDWAVTVVLASGGYPASSSSGDEISGLRAADSIEVELLHAGTAERDGRIVTAGGRVLNVTGIGSTPAEAREHAYRVAEKIQFDGKQMRRDIAERAVARVEEVAG